MKKITSLRRSIKIYGLRETLNRYGHKAKYYILKHILKRKTAVRKVHGSKMVLDLVNPGISHVLYVAGTREDLDVAIVKQELKPGMNVLEAGANIGYYLLLEGKILAGNGTIYAFEPDPRNVVILKANIMKNKLEKHVKFYPYAVSNNNAVEKLFLTNASNLSTMAFRRSSDDTCKEVKTIAIDNFKEIDREINFIRMDIEGYEYEAIGGMLATLERNRPVKILMELHPQYYNENRDFVKVIEKLFELGFFVKYITSAGHHSPKEILDLGYKAKKIAQEMEHSHGLYDNIEKTDFIKILNNKKKIVRSMLLIKE